MVYFQSTKGFVHEVSDDQPARKKIDGKMGPIKEMAQGEDIEVFLESAWVPGYVKPQPTNFKFMVECVSFGDENAVWRALETVLRDFHGKPNSPIPWIKIVPPSKQPRTL